MKKHLVIGIVILMGVFLLVGCGESKKSKKDETIVLKENKSVCDDILVESEDRTITVGYIITIMNRKVRCMHVVRQTAIMI